MKITVHSISGKIDEFQLDNPRSSTILEIKRKIYTTINGKAIGWNINEILISAIKKDDRTLGYIALDENVDQNFFEFVKRESELDLTEADHLHLYILLSLTGTYGYKKTDKNPSGRSAYLPPATDVQAVFFSSALSKNVAETYQEKSARLGCSDFPEKFLDPVTSLLMNNPVIATDGRTYDQSTLERLNFISPFSREPLSSLLKINLHLRSEIEKFLKDAEETFAIQGSM